jgi:hypothetical protein
VNKFRCSSGSIADLRDLITDNRNRGFPMEHETIVTKRIEIRNDDNVPVIVMGTDHHTSLPVIEMYDGKSPWERISIIIDQNGPLISVRHPESSLVAANLRVFNDGRAVCGAYGTDQMKEAVVAIDMNGEPVVEIRDSEGKVVFHAPD